MDTQDHVQSPASSNEVDEVLDTDAARRRMLVRLGVYGAATVPVLLGALKADRAVAQTGGGIPGGGIPGGGGTGGGGGVVF